MKAKYNIATATSRFQAIWQNVSLTWEQLVDKTLSDSGKKWKKVSKKRAPPFEMPCK